MFSYPDVKITKLTIIFCLFSQYEHSSVRFFFMLGLCSVFMVHLEVRVLSVCLSVDLQNNVVIVSV